MSSLPTSPTGRVPAWVRDEAAGRPTSASPWRAWAPPPPVPARRGRRAPRLRGVALVAVVVAVALGAAWLAGPPAVDGAAVATSADWPTAGVGAADLPMGTPPELDSVGPHAFVALQDDGVTPVGYDPCRVIHYVVRPDHAPPGGDALLAEAFAHVTAVTGLQFVAEGPTDEAHLARREPFQPDRYGDRWAPVLVTWQTPAENPDFLTSTVGLAGSLPVRADDGPLVFVTGTVQLDADWFGAALTTPDGAVAARAVVLHEVGHLVGLDHVEAVGQLMHPTNHGVPDFAAGDLEGLARLGGGACEPGL